MNTINHTHEPQVRQDEFEELSLIELLAVLFRYWRFLFACGLLTVILAGGATTSYLFSGRESSSLVARMEFEGADVGEYPNDLIFSANDITAMEVLRTVYEANSLAQFKMDLLDFGRRLTVIKTNRGLEKLEAKYAGALGDKKLSREEREKIQAGYEAERKALVAVPEYTLRLDGADLRMPKNVQAKVLSDVFKEWARYSQERRGIFLYQIPMISVGVLDEGEIHNSEYIIAADMLRVLVRRVIDACEEVSKLPGATLVQTKETNMSLKSLQIRLEDAITFKHRKFVTLLRSTGAVRDPKMVEWYIASQSETLNREISEVEKRVELLKEARQGYAPFGSDPHSGNQGSSQQGQGRVGLQLGDDFLNRVVAMASDSSESEYRQEINEKILQEGNRIASLEKEVAYYQDLQKKLTQLGGPKHAGPRDKYEERIVGLLTELKTEAINGLNIVNEIYLEICKQHLQPEATMFSITDPVSFQKERAMDLKKVLVGDVAFIVVVMSVLAFSCLIYDRMRNLKSN